MWWNVEVHPGAEMQVSAVNKVPRPRNGEKEVEAFQSLLILEFLRYIMKKGEF